jgi:hypothetical protein
MLSKSLVPATFKIPDEIKTEEFRLRMLTVNDVIKDYDAVMSSVDRLTTVFGDDSGWPHGLTIEQDLIDLGWHQKEFQRRTSFAYTVMGLDETTCLGCVYIMPPYRGQFDASAFDAAVFLWVRDSAYATGMDERLYIWVKQWIAATWPFKAVAYPGREIAWEEWRSPLE